MVPPEGPPCSGRYLDPPSFPGPVPEHAPHGSGGGAADVHATAMALENDVKGPTDDHTARPGRHESPSGSDAPPREAGRPLPLDASELFQTAFRASPDAVNINRLEDGMFVDANDGFTALTGYTRDDITGRTSLEIELWAHPEDRARLVDALARTGGVQNMEARFRRKDGSVGWGLMSARVLPIEGVPHILSITRDITDRKEAEERFHETQSRLNAVVSGAPVVLWALDRDGRFTLSEGLGLESLGLRPGEAVGRIVYELYADFPEVLSDIRAALKGKRITANHRVQDRVFQSRLIPTFASDGKVAGMLGVSLDVTQETILQAQLLQAQKLEAVGRLAGGVAHDFNNLLTAIRGYTELLEERLSEPLPDDPGALREARRDLDEIRRAADRAASLTAQLLAFSRKQVLEMKVLDLNLLVGEVERMLRRLIGEDVELTTELATDLRYVAGDASQLEQVVVNLAVNARDAMPQGGRLLIATRNEEVSEPISGEYEEIPAGSYVVLSVVDSGSGIPEAHRPHIFEPFFTTKEQGKGTGLGLPTVFGIVSQSGGHIQVHSEVGVGTTFEVWLPATDEAVPDERPGVLADVRLGGETVLLVEDDDAVRSFAAQVLARSGYRVLEAADAQTALELSRHWEGPIELLVTDVVMPGMGGKDLADMLQSERAGLRVLFISGYAGEADVTEDFRGARKDFLGKPFSPAALSSRVRKVLDGAAEPDPGD